MTRNKMEYYKVCLRIRCNDKSEENELIHSYQTVIKVGVLHNYVLKSTLEKYLVEIASFFKDGVNVEILSVERIENLI